MSFQLYPKGMAKGTGSTILFVLSPVFRSAKFEAIILLASVVWTTDVWQDWNPKFDADY